MIKDDHHTWQYLHNVCHIMHGPIEPLQIGVVSW